MCLKYSTLKFWNYENVRDEGEKSNGHFTALVPYKTLLLLLLLCVIRAPRAKLQTRKEGNLGKWKKKKIKRVNIGQKCKQL